MDPASIKRWKQTLQVQSILVMLKEGKRDVGVSVNTWKAAVGVKTFTLNAACWIRAQIYLAAIFHWGFVFLYKAFLVKYRKFRQRMDFKFVILDQSVIFWLFHAESDNPVYFEKQNYKGERQYLYLFRLAMYELSILFLAENFWSEAFRSAIIELYNLIIPYQRLETIKNKTKIISTQTANVSKFQFSCCNQFSQLLMLLFFHPIHLYVCLTLQVEKLNRTHF